MFKLTVTPLVGVMLCCALALTPRAHAETLQASELRGAAGEPLCLDVLGGRAESGTDLTLYPCHGGQNQAFTYHPESGELRSALGNFCVDVWLGGAFSGSRVHLWECNGLGAQNFDYDARTARAPPNCAAAPTAGASTSTCARATARRASTSSPSWPRTTPLPTTKTRASSR